MTHTTAQVGLLARVLDAASLRHRTIAQNVANVNTPGYSRREVTFDDELASLVRPGSSVRDAARVVEAEGGPRRADGNNVSLEREMGDLDKNRLLYTAAAQLLTTRLGMLRSAISGQ